MNGSKFQSRGYSKDLSLLEAQVLTASIVGWLESAVQVENNLNGLVKGRGIADGVAVGSAFVVV